jgi:hypothetical protein
MPGKRLLYPLLFLLLLVVIAYALFATVLRLPGGPLAESESFRAVGARGVGAGETRTFFAPLLRNRSGESVTLQKIEPLRRTPGLQIRGIRIVTRLPAGGATDATGFPPRLGGGLRVRKVDGTEIKGDESVRAAVGVRLTRPGARTIRGFRVEYRYRGLRRSVELKDEITVTSRP